MLIIVFWDTNLIINSAVNSWKEAVSDQLVKWKGHRAVRFQKSSFH